MSRSLIVLSVVALALASSGVRSSAADESVEPDRPDVSDSAKTVPPGAVQVESGLQYDRESRAGRRRERTLSIQADLRIGILERLEGRIQSLPLVHMRGEEDDTGPGDVTLGVKYRFLDAAEGSRWPALALLPSVKVPVADAPIGTERPDFSVLGLASFDLPAGFGLDVNAGLAAIGQSRPSGYLVQGLATASLSVEAAQGLKPFVEIAYGSRDERDGTDSVALNAGAVYLASRRVALDAAVGTSLTGRGPDYVIKAGVTFRLGR